MINTGYIEGTKNGSLIVRIYYDQNATPVGPSQPLVNGPRGYCMDVTNTSGSNQRVSVSNGTQAVTAQVGQGDPVTTGNARSRTAAQMAALGFVTRGDVQDFQIG